LAVLQIFNDSVDAYATWTLFLIFVSILILISGVVLLTHKKPESVASQRDATIALNAIPGRQVPRALDGKIDESEGSLVEDRGEDGTQAVWDVGEASDDEDEHAKLTPRPEGLAKAGHGEEGEHLMSASLDDGDGDNARSHVGSGVRSGRPVTRRRSTSTLQRRDKDGDGDDKDGFGEFTEA